MGLTPKVDPFKSREFPLTVAEDEVREFPSLTDTLLTRPLLG